MRKFTLWIIFGLSFCTLRAQVSPLDTVLISSSRLPLSASQTGRNITLIEGEDIKKLPVQSLDELLRYIPSLELQTRNSFGAQADLTMRGGTFAQSLVLIDGVRINDPLTGHFSTYIPIALSDISRIEIVRGPGTTLYGPDAVGGLVHIITKAFDTQRTYENRVQAQAAYGQYNLLAANGGAQVANDKVLFTVGANWNMSDGEPLPPDSTDIRNDFNVLTTSAGLRYKLNDTYTLTAKGAFDRRLFNAQYFYTRSTFDLSREETRQALGQVRLTRQGNNSQTHVDFSYKRMRDSFLFNPLFTANVHTTQFAQAQVHHQQVINDQFSFGAGLQADQRTIVSNDRGDHENLHAGVYVNGAYQPVTGLNLNASLRLDYDDNYGLELLPQFQASYVLSGAVLRAAVGRATRAPDYTERFVSTQLSNLTPGRNLGNPDLLAERAWSYEVGTDITLSRGFTFSGTVFYRQDENLIDYLLTPEDEIPRNESLQDSAEYFFATNILSLGTLGLEASVQGVQEIGSVTLQGILGYQYLYSNTETDRLARYISNRARHLVNGSVTLSWKSIDFTLNGIYKAREEASAEAIGAVLPASYLVFNTRLQVRTWNDRLAIFLQANNLTDAEYQDILGSRLPGRWVMIGIQVQ
ncbi:MAG: TonB-dependent receptor [Bacteroidota bacterium]